jgi:signal transduction histidine kinase
MGRDVREALHRVQALADEIYPVLLDARGLPDALTAVAAAAGVPAKVEATGLGRHAAGVEMAVYLCGLASLENVAAHAGVGARATIRLREEPDTINLEVADNGAGFDPAAHPPTGGLAAARARVEALDGRMTVDSQPGRGTCVEATLPLYEPPPAR